MLIEIQKTETREIPLTETRYVSFADKMYYRFTPTEDNIRVLHFQERNDELDVTSKLGLYDSQVGILELTREYAKEITEDEFNTKLQELLLKYI